MADLHCMAPTRRTTRRAVSVAERRGFSLAELLIVVLTLAVAATVIVPMVGENETTQLRAAARMLVADLEFARSESMVHDLDGRMLVLDGRRRGYAIVTTGNPTTPVVHPADGGSYMIRYGEGWAAELGDVSVVGFALGGDTRLGFGIYGQLDQTSDATITLGTPGHTITVTLNADTGDAEVGEIVER